MSLDPADHGVTNKTMGAWRTFLKQELLKQRGYRSDLSGRLFTYESGCEMHEGILSRANVPASLSWQWMIMHPYNVSLLLPEEHRPNPPSREWAISKAYARYGREAVKTWFDSLPFKYTPFQLP